MVHPASLLTPLQRDDLGRSGLTEDTIEQMGIRPASMIDFEHCGLNPAGMPADAQPYVIPYFDMQGKKSDYYRIKLLQPGDGTDGLKYLQPRATPTRVYFPPGFLALAERSPFVLITEGEKKAAAAMQVGLPCVALGGVDSWRNRTFELNVESLKHSSDYTEHRPDTSKLIVKLANNNGDPVRELEATVAMGLPELVDMLKLTDKEVLIVFDTDLPGPPFIRPEVQRAAADFAFYLRSEGRIRVGHIRQLVLPPRGLKTGLDDILAAGDEETLRKLIRTTCDSRAGATYPRRPDIKSWIRRRMNASRMGRMGAEKIVMSVLAEMDAQGRRLRAPNSCYYYFDEDRNTVQPAAYVGSNERFLLDAEFGKRLYQQYGLVTRDARVRDGVLDAFIGEEPIEDVEPHRGLRIQTGSVDFQLNDNQFARVTAEGVKVVDNGNHGTLFLAGQVESLEMKQSDIEDWDLPETPWWLDVLGDLQLDAFEGCTEQETKEFVASLFYISPWLNRWRGTQLPVEIACAEAGSGKSSIYALRLLILTGRPELHNVPVDIRDWYAAIADSPGMWVGDNVRITSRDVRQRLSDELCRLTTEPDPHITLRRLYTTSDRARIPARTTFALTSIQPPFYSMDLAQRSVILRFNAIPEGKRLSNWVESQIERFGGRKPWVLHHLDVISKFLKASQGYWIDDYRSYHRLANFEQALLMMGDVLGLTNLNRDVINRVVQNIVADSGDVTIEGLKAFIDEWGPKQFTAGDVVEWAELSESFKQDLMLTNARRLGRYIQAHKHAIQTSTGVVIGPKLANRFTYRVEKKP